MKRHSSAVFLMELTLVILFFSLSAVVTLRLFVTAHQQEQQSALRSDALELAEDAAEQFHAQGAAFFDSADGWSSTPLEQGGTVYSWDGSDLLLEVFLQQEDTGAGALESGEVRITGSEKSVSRGQVLCSLPVGRYIPKEAGGI
ncbi:MAG: hypothetical protein HFE86_01795 [Clostridiales bacterium]|nr:hypothetical protein [Clostridiales bacterium]